MVPVWLEWLDPPMAFRRLDIGCGTGPFTNLALRRCEPLSIDGVGLQPAIARARGSASERKDYLSDQGDAHNCSFANGQLRPSSQCALVLSFLADRSKVLN